MLQTKKRKKEEKKGRGKTAKMKGEGMGVYQDAVIEKNGRKKAL
jgi:hypothetical protein